MSITINNQHSDGWVMVWAGINYVQWTQEHFIDGNSSTQRYCDEIFRPIVMPFIASCYSMIMHSPMLQRAVLNSWKLKTSQFLHGLHTHQTYHLFSMFGLLWIDLYDSRFQFLPISSNFAKSFKRSGPICHRPQSITWSTLCEWDVSHCVRQMVFLQDKLHMRAFYCDQSIQ